MFGLLWRKMNISNANVKSWPVIDGCSLHDKETHAVRHCCDYTFRLRHGLVGKFNSQVDLTSRIIKSLTSTVAWSGVLTNFKCPKSAANENGVCIAVRKTLERSWKGTVLSRPVSCQEPALELQAFWANGSSIQAINIALRFKYGGFAMFSEWLVNCLRVAGCWEPMCIEA